MQSGSHGCELPHGRRPQKRPQGDKKHEAQPTQRAADQAHQVHVGHIREVYDFAPYKHRTVELLKVSKDKQAPRGNVRS